LTNDRGEGWEDGGGDDDDEEDSESDSSYFSDSEDDEAAAEEFANYRSMPCMPRTKSTPAPAPAWRDRCVTTPRCQESLLSALLKKEAASNHSVPPQSATMPLEQVWRQAGEQLNAQYPVLRECKACIKDPTIALETDRKLMDSLVRHRTDADDAVYHRSRSIALQRASPSQDGPSPHSLSPLEENLARLVPKKPRARSLGWDGPSIFLSIVRS